ncbi:DUF5082 family protein [Bacillus swezeyi]|uniref:DUF5082 domain-containing protein n=2 Tax=Bacillus swezeyi TaxID=1925020 RepID=A0A1R1S1I8_9BACI|nr:DUF5082 family protein [Bacillus swezeyi]MEC1259070.1 DUF5082 family protein [Bacillus swezeyi]MED2927969.1 DUF5082 family protein [Bacillus swezeyi]MED2942229.1 DUF5082 family protein [Bacillus swezeyi]MED2965119.1 DUF5082 family protein [Bacillus swezeyi]MED2977776.1 DUF5082 family protein [Bacillus swezeyi]
MSYSDMLDRIHAAISNQSADLEEKISRLKRAKNKIETEQNTSLEEIKKIRNPSLGSSWQGSRSETFDESRDEAYNEMQNIITDDYESYKTRIQSKIVLLEIEQGALSAARGLAHTADQLLTKGEEALEELGSTISDLTRRLF